MSTTQQTTNILERLIANELMHAVMIWGAPGIGKSTIVKDIATRHKIGFVDIRLGQLAPTDLRGVPFPDAKTREAEWFPPSFLPKSGSGILFLDEINLAPPVMQGLAQQLVLDRRIGTYELPKGWFAWAAGNRKSDRASTFSMPAPLANRFLHLEVVADMEEWAAWAQSAKVDSNIVAFLHQRPNMLHELGDGANPAFPSPRSWAMASDLLKVGLTDIACAVGPGAATEFMRFTEATAAMPNLSAILAGDPKVPGYNVSDPSLSYAVTIGLAFRAKSADEAANALRYMIRVKSGMEYVALGLRSILPMCRKLGANGMKALDKLINETRGSEYDLFKAISQITTMGSSQF